MIIPNNFYFGYVSQSPSLHQVMSRAGVRLAAMLCAHLDNPIVLLYRVTCRLGLSDNVSHRLFNISIFAGFGSHFQNGRVRVLRGGYDDRINVGKCEHILQILECTRRPAIVLRILFDGPFAVEVPQITDGRHLYIVSGLMLGNYPVQFLASVSRANVGERNSIVRTWNPSVRNRVRDHGSANQRR